MTYAQYARRGFSELCTVSGINAAVTAAALIFTKKEDSKSPFFRIVMSALSLFSMILIVISLQKMILYIEIYNLTPHRVYSSWFMLFLLLCFSTALVKLWVKKLNFMKISVIGLASQAHRLLQHPAIRQ